jgi:hypothetical protein
MWERFESLELSKYAFKVLELSYLLRIELTKKERHLRKLIILILSEYE